MPDAPPVTKATAPSIFMSAAKKDRLKTRVKIHLTESQMTVILITEQCVR